MKANVFKAILDLFPIPAPSTFKDTKTKFKFEG